MDRATLAGMIDQTLLKPTVGYQHAAAWMESAAPQGFAALCISPFLVALASQRLAGTSTKVCSVCGFPLGYMNTESKVEEAAHLVQLGCDEVDMVLNFAALLEGDDRFVHDDIAAVARTVEVRPALAWKSRVVYFKVTQPGHPVSYGSTWQSDHPVRIVTVPVGYGDGYFRIMSNKAWVLINGKKYAQVGRICMDQIMVNIESDSAFNGDEVLLIGESGDERITAEDLATWAGTIPYEVLTNINTRVPRVYLGG
jgi:hypothetical protein